jgi:hypothetical protein
VLEKCNIDKMDEEMRSQFLTAESMKKAFYWDVAPCSLQEVGTSEASVRFNQTTWCNIREDSHLYV